MLVVDGDLAEASRMRKRRKKNVLLMCFLSALLKGCWRGQRDDSMDQALTIQTVDLSSVPRIYMKSGSYCTSVQAQYSYSEIRDGDKKMSWGCPGQIT